MIDLQKIKHVVVIMVCFICVCAINAGLAMASDNFQSSYANGRLTLNAVDVPILKLLKTVSKSASFDVFVSEHLKTDKVINLQISDILLENALKRILRNFSYAAIYKKSGNSLKLTAVKIFPKGKYSDDVIPAFTQDKAVEVVENSEETKTVLVSSGEDVITYGGLKDGGFLVPSLTLPSSADNEFVAANSPWLGMQKQMEHEQLRKYEELMLMQRTLENADDPVRKEALALIYAEEANNFHAMKTAHLNKIEGLKRIHRSREITGN